MHTCEEILKQIQSDVELIAEHATFRTNDIVLEKPMEYISIHVKLK